MEEEYMDFSQYIRSKRSEQNTTLKEVSSALGISLSMLSDIEQGRRKPFKGEKIEKFSAYLHLLEEEKSHIYDLVARKTGKVPEDIEDILMYSPIGDLARQALRLSNEGLLTEEDWAAFIEPVRG